MNCKNSSLCIFDEPGMLTDTQRSYTVEYYPLSSVTSHGPIEFHVPGNADDYIDLNDINLYVQFKVLKEDGSKVDQAKDKVAFTNLGIASLFQDASLMIGETQMEGGHMNYPYHAYFKTVMEFSPAAQEAQMQTFGWYKDQAKKFDDEGNDGFKKRQAVVGDSSTVELMGPLYFDIFAQDRPLISQTSLRIKLMPNKAAFALQSFSATGKADYKIAFEKVILYVVRQELNPSVINGHNLGLMKHNAKYHINHSDLVTFTIPKGQKSYTKDHLFPEVGPKLLMIAMVDNEAFNGHIKKNPFNFKHFDLNQIALYSDGRSVPGQPLTPDFDRKLYLRSYNMTMRSFSYMNSDETNGMTPEEWANGTTIYAFDMTPDKDVATDCIQQNLNKNLRLDLNFAKPLPETINVLVFALSNSKIEITRLREAIPFYTR